MNKNTFFIIFFLNLNSMKNKYQNVFILFQLNQFLTIGKSINFKEMDIFTRTRKNSLSNIKITNESLYSNSPFSYRRELIIIQQEINQL